MADNVVSYVGISDRIAYRKLILLSSKDIITALNTYEQIKVIRKKKHEIMKQIDENINSIVKVKEKLDRSFPVSAYDSLIKSVKIKEEELKESSSEKDFEKYLNKMKGAHKSTKKKATIETKKIEEKVSKTIEKPKTEIKKEAVVEKPIKVEAPKKVTRFEKLQMELEDIENKLSTL